MEVIDIDNIAHTQSWAFPNMFDLARNQINILTNGTSVVNRTRLLMLTEPTELYNSPDFGVGLREHIFKYNNQNEKAIIADKILDQLRRHEPYVDPEDTKFADGLLFSPSDGTESKYYQYNKLKMTVALSCTFGDNVEVSINDEN